MNKFYILLLFPLLIFSQSIEQKRKIETLTNKEVLKTISESNKIYFSENKIKAIKLAKIYNWPITLKNNGTYSELMGVSLENLPIYYSTYNYGAGVTTRANKLYTGGSLGLNINGENMTAGVWDVGTTMPNHELFSGRVQVIDNTQTNRFHATHVAGTIIGTDQVQNGNARGIAYKGNVNSYDWNNDISEVAAAASNGLLFSNHSYGRNPIFVSTNEWGKYNLTAQSLDDIMFNAPYYQFVCAAGNNRSYGFNIEKNGYDLLLGNAISKNGIAVAAVNELLEYTGTSSVIMSEFSSWGSTDDGRIKPDISAKGVNTYSSVDSSTSSYDTLSGTSMASPSVVGTLMLFQQYYNQLNDNFMKASTVKGLMIHTADEAGTSPGPDYKFGWGLINAEKAADVITKNQVQSFILENTLIQSNSYSITVNAIGTEPLKATLCWTDPKGIIPNTVLDSSTPNLINDLDVRITQNNNSYLPWKLNGSNNPTAPAIKGDNVVDNVEKIELENATGSYTITVSNKGNLLNNAQNYSLIISGISVKDFWFTTTEKSKSICNGTNSIAYTFDLHTKSNFIDTVSYSTIGLPAGILAVFSPISMNAAGSFNLTLNNLTSLPLGVYNFIVKGNSTNGFFEIPVKFTILTPPLSNVFLLQPANNSSSIGLPVTFSWLADINAQQYDIQIANDANFTSIIQTATATQTSFTSTLLTNNTTYFWRVKPKNSCASGSFSTVNTFSTVCGLPTNILLVVATTTSATIGWTENSSATLWEVEIVPQGNTPSGIGTIINANPYLISGLNSNTCYDFYVRSKCGDSTSRWTKRYAFCTQLDYCNGDHFYDSGGITGNYENYENKITTIFPANSGDRIKVVFNSFAVYYGDNYLKIYNGPNASYPVLYSGNGYSNPGTFTSTDSSGALTFIFTSGYSVTNSAGWDASIICEPLPSCPAIPSAITLISSSYNSASIGWTENTGATSWNIEIVPHGTTPTGIGILTTSNPYITNTLNSNSDYDFYVRSNCLVGTSDWTNPYRFFTPGNYCGGEHFYDDGGPNGNYQQYSQNTIIYPTGTGNRVKAIFNSFDLNNNDSFVVYDGNTLIFSRNYSNPISPTTLVATNPQGTLTFQFYNYTSQTNLGWDATIICEALPPCPALTSYHYVTNITTTSATFHWTENSGAALWEIEIVPHGTTPTGVGVITTNNNFIKTGLTSNTWYDFYVRSRCSNGNSDWSTPVTFNTLANYCTGDHFYDTGGPNDNYLQNNTFQSTTIYPTGTGNRVKAIFNSFVLNSTDSFAVYDGDTLIFSRNSNNPISPTTLVATNLQGTLRFVFYNNSNQTNIGWDATIVCEPLTPCSSPPIFYGSPYVTSTSATFDWQENSNATSWEIEIVPQGTTPTGIGVVTTSKPFEKNGLTSNTAYDLYIRSLCGAVNSIWTLPITFTTIPNYCAGDHFYDNGGPNDNYLPNTYQSTTIYPTGTGNRVKAIFNSFDLNSEDYFNVFDGSTLIFSRNSSNPISPTILISTNPQGTLTFQFYSNSNQTNLGWDATIVCEPSPPCLRPPSFRYTTNITTTSATYSWQENSNATSWEIEIVPQGTTPTGVGVITANNPYTKNGLTSNTWYDLYVRSRCGDVNSVWALPVTFNTIADYCAGDHFYDFGGPNRNYPQNSNTYITIFPTGTGNRVKATFNSFILNDSDVFNVYDGNTLIFSRNSSNPISPTILAATNPQGTLGFQFNSSSGQTNIGWDATIVCEPIPPCTTQPSNIIANNLGLSSVVINWIENANATSWEIEVVLMNSLPIGQGTVYTSNPVTLSGLLSNTCYDIYIRSVCGNTNSTWSSVYSFCTLSDYCAGDHFYDSGGANGYYQDNENITTTIYPQSPAGKVKLIFNSFNLEGCCDYMKIYNGPNTASPLLYSSNGLNSPGAINSTHSTGTLTVLFKSDSNTTYSGWDATVSCQSLSINNSNSFDNNIAFYPNPVQGVLNIVSKNPVKKYIVYDINMRIILKEEINSNEFTIKFQEFSSGAYFVKLLDDDGNSKNIKIIKD